MSFTKEELLAMGAIEPQEPVTDASVDRMLTDEQRAIEAMTPERRAEFEAARAALIARVSARLKGW